MNNVEIHIAQADFHFQNNELDEAYDSLRAAGALGHVYAALDFAYYRVKDDPDAALQYLTAISGQENPTIKFHCLLINRFYISRVLNEEIVKGLLELANIGHAESLIVLLSWTESDNEVFCSLKERLFFHKPTIYRQLFSKVNQPSISNTSKVDIASVTAAISKTRVSLLSKPVKYLDKDRIVCSIKGALSPFECTYMIMRYKSLLQPSMVLNPINGSPMVDEVRTSEVGVISNQWVDWISREIEVKMAKFSKTPICNGEPLNLLRYTNGQQYKPHYDGFSEAQLIQASIQDEGGQRTHTVLAYLNSLNEGATYFPKLDIEVIPEQGKLVYFINSDDNGRIKTKSYHCGKPVITSEKWMLTKWVRTNRTQYGNLAFGINC